MYPWQAIQKYNQAKQDQKDKLGWSVKIIIQHRCTVKKSVKDFPMVHQYLYERFPGVPAHSIYITPIYLCDPAIMRNQGFYHIGGCFIPHLQVILVVKKIENGVSPPRLKFDRLLSKHHASADIEDIIVHELLHVISSKIGRSSRKFPHMEEEFVYTNCVDFYKKKGMTEEEIVTKNFLPFCIEDVFSIRGELDKIIAQLAESGIIVSDFYDQHSYKRFMSRHAEVLVEKIVARAKEMGQRMIDLYNGPGEDQAESTNALDVSEMRFVGLDLS